MHQHHSVRNKTVRNFCNLELIETWSWWPKYQFKHPISIWLYKESIYMYTPITWANKIILRGNELSFQENELFPVYKFLFHGNEIMHFVLWRNELILQGNKNIFRGNELFWRNEIFRGKEILFRGSEIIFRGNESLFRGNESLLRENTILLTVWHFKRVFLFFSQGPFTATVFLWVFSH